MTDLSFHVRQHVPAAEGDELKHRTALLKARDFAATLLGSTTSEDAYALAHMAHEMAGRFCFAEVPAVRLELAVKYCRHAVQAAFLADHLDSEGTER